ncbi:unnamed protein product [Toxocara canis]|uniref:HTH_Tnp_Tc3_1 domain-containing protein n=1 Tax=Toxocara canis TaxID=6265 RepID=A0A183U524_TOXCA|nr:unnamed protein product [Toxocara canis]
MERCMLAISLREHIRCEEISRRTGVRDVIAEYRKQKLRWAGHVSNKRRQMDSRGCRVVPYGTKSTSRETSKKVERRIRTRRRKNMAKKSKIESKMGTHCDRQRHERSIARQSSDPVMSNDKTSHNEYFTLPRNF